MPEIFYPATQELGVELERVYAMFLPGSRFKTTYTLGDEVYLPNTWHASTRPASLKLGEQPASQWIGLKVLRHEQPDDTHAIAFWEQRGT